MLARHAVLLSSSHRSPLLSRQQLSSLNPLDATLTENREERGVMVNQHPPELDVWTFRRSDVAAFQRTFHSLFSLFAQRVFHNSFAFTGIRTLSENCRGVPQQFPFWNSTPRLRKRIRFRPLAFSSPMYSICLPPGGLAQLRLRLGLEGFSSPVTSHRSLPVTSHESNDHRQQRSESRRHAARRLPVPVRLQHQPQNHRPQLSLARALQRFPWHGHVAAHAHPSGLSGDASLVSLQPRQLAGTLCRAHYAPWFADGFSGAHRGAPGRLRKLLPSAANRRARNGFPHAEPPRVLGHGCLALRPDDNIFPFP